VHALISDIGPTVYVLKAAKVVTLAYNVAMKKRKKKVWLGEGLLNWSLARTPHFEHTVNPIELALAHRSAYELCDLALTQLATAKDAADAETWRDLFARCVISLTAFETDESFSMLKSLEEDVLQMDDDVLKFHVSIKLLAFRSEQLRAAERLMGIPVGRNLIRDREYFLSALLEGPPGMDVAEETRQAVARMVLDLPMDYSTPASKRRFTAYANHLLGISTPRAKRSKAKL
jgi:uncharacterized membrane protein YecN with MAPEG domain